MVCRFTFGGDADRVRAFITRFPCCMLRNTDLLERAILPFGPGSMPATAIAPPLRVQNDGSLQCVAVNLTAADAPVGFKIDDGSGNVIAMVDAAVPAGRALATSTTQDLSDAFCACATDGDPGNLRGYATLTNETALRTELLFEALPPGPPSTPTPR